MARTRSTEKAEEQEELFPHPRRITALEGHEAARRMMAEGLARGALHHAWLITGSRGVGKASLAYLFAKYMLGEETLSFESFSVPGTPFPAHRKVAEGFHPDLLVIEAGVSEGKKTRDINVDDVRRVKDFLALTPAEGTWRIVLVDSADDMNMNAANALLKLLEEPPANALMLLVSHRPGALLPTIRSRCRVLHLHPLGPEQTRSVVSRYVPEAVASLMGLAKGAPGLALWLHGVNWQAMYKAVLDALAGGGTAPLASLAAEKDRPEAWEALNFLLSTALARAASGASGVAVMEELIPGERAVLQKLAGKGALSLVELRENLLQKLFEAQRFHLDKKLALTAAFSEI
ncbi:MAG: DNA polymerase III subunit delta' [Alphaproteobacteria bacterium]|nr:DNA polymerase III subunit delta' [Alphaproteobacteria bacterium]